MAYFPVQKCPTFLPHQAHPLATSPLKDEGYLTETHLHWRGFLFSRFSAFTNGCESEVLQYGGQWETMGL